MPFWGKFPAGARSFHWTPWNRPHLCMLIWRETNMRRVTSRLEVICGKSRRRPESLWALKLPPGVLSLRQLLNTVGKETSNFLVISIERTSMEIRPNVSNLKKSFIDYTVYVSSSLCIRIKKCKSLYVCATIEIDFLDMYINFWNILKLIFKIDTTRKYVHPKIVLPKVTMVVTISVSKHMYFSVITLPLITCTF